MTSIKYPLASSSWGQEETDALQRVISSDHYTMSSYVQDFEKLFAKTYNCADAVMVNSGSSANLLMLSLLRWKLGLADDPDANIIVPAVSWSTTFFPVIQNNFKLNFVDIDPDTFNIDVSKIEAAINEKTVAIFAVNLLGCSCDYDTILQLCNKYNIILLEDNCESMGATWRDKMLGTVGRMGSFSFFFSHHIQTMEGGMIATENAQDAEYLRSLRAHGWYRELNSENSILNKTNDKFNDAFTFVTPGYNLRPLEMSGAVGIEQLRKFPEILEQRIKNHKLFASLFEDKSYIRIQKDLHGTSSWFSFGCVLQGDLESQRHRVLQKFDEYGIETRPIAGRNFLNQPVMNNIDYIKNGTYTAAEDIDKNGFFVGNHCTDCSQGIYAMYEALESLS